MIVLRFRPRKPLCAANRAALKQTLNRPCREFGLRNHRGSRQSRVRFAKGRFAGIAAPTLNAALTEVPKPFAGLVLASEAGHVISPLAFCGETSQNTFGSEAWVTPRFGLAPQPVCAGSGALSVKGYPLGWNNGYFHRWTVSSETNHNHDFHCVPPFSRRSLVPPAGGSYLKPKSFSLFFLLAPTTKPNCVYGRSFQIHVCLQFSGLHHAPKCRGNGRKRIGLVCTEIKPGLHKRVPNSAKRKAGISLLLEHLPDRISQRCGARRSLTDGLVNLLFQLFPFRIRHHIESGVHELPQLHQFNINFLAVCVQIAESLKRVPDKLFIVRLNHRRSMRQCLTHVKQQES